MTGVERIAAERKRQVEVEGWTPEHDDTHDGGEMALAAICYASPERIYTKREDNVGFEFRDPWPWDSEDDKRRLDRNSSCPNYNLSRIAKIRKLEKAGALIAAEIDRLLRLK